MWLMLLVDALVRPGIAFSVGPLPAGTPFPTPPQGFVEANALSL